MGRGAWGTLLARETCSGGETTSWDLEQSCGAAPCRHQFSAQRFGVVERAEAGGVPTHGDIPGGHGSAVAPTCSALVLRPPMSPGRGCVMVRWLLGA